MSFSPSSYKHPHNDAWLTEVSHKNLNETGQFSGAPEFSEGERFHLVVSNPLRVPTARGSGFILRERNRIKEERPRAKIKPRVGGEEDVNPTPRAARGQNVTTLPP